MWMLTDLQSDVSRGGHRVGAGAGLIRPVLCVGGGPTLDYDDVTAFLDGFESMIEKVRKRRLQ